MDENGLRQRFAQGDAGVANLANDIVVAADQPDLLILNQAKLAQTVTDFGPAGELFDADARADLHAAQGTHRLPGALALQNLIGWRHFFVHGGAT